MLDGHLELTHVDEFVDDLLTKDIVCDVTLPRIPLRWTLEATGALQPRRSVLEDGMDDALAAAEAAAGHAGGGALPPPPPGGAADRDGRARRSRSRSRDGRGPRARSGSPQERQDRPGRDAFAEDGADLNDVNQVNALRAKLGMKPLR
jgi:pre-mRNA-splicing factor 38A